MASSPPTEPITVRASKQTVNKIDAIAAAMDRSRNYVINQALDQYLQTNAWQMERIKAGLAAALAGDVEPADAVFDRIAERHGWTR